jgi:formylmethanofuran dehydrogenase subunit A
MLRITGGEIYDPSNGVNGEVRDIWVAGGKIVAPPQSEREREEAQVIDAAGAVVMAGGVDIHSHIVGAKVNGGRKFRPEDHREHERLRTAITRSGAGYTTPTTFMTGYMYAEMGYTTVIEAATAPIVARHSHEELDDTPMLDKGFYVTMANNHFVMRGLGEGRRDEARDYVAWLLDATKGYGIKMVNPGGVENWKWGSNVEGLDDEVIGFNVTPRKILTGLADIAAELGLPHPIHVHTINLGTTGNYRTTIETMEAMEGRQIHLCHIQFFSYKGKRGQVMRSAAREVAEAVNRHENVTVDIGQVLFGPATTMTSDGPLEYKLHKLSGNKWLNDDVEAEGGGGVVPMQYKAANVANATQWAIGLELFLLLEDPWRLYLTTDHPNGGPFFLYPHLIHLLMSKDFRAEQLSKINARVAQRSILAQLEREYSLYEIAIMTRAGTARRLGLVNKGHLGVGADADITIYNKDLDDIEGMFGRPRYVIKGGLLVVRDGQVVQAVQGRTLVVRASWDKRILEQARAHFENYYTISFDNYAVQEEYLHEPQIIHARGG